MNRDTVREPAVADDRDYQAFPNIVAEAQSGETVLRLTLAETMAQHSESVLIPQGVGAAVR
jgi:hypothetical protein